MSDSCEGMHVPKKMDSLTRYGAAGVQNSGNGDGSMITVALRLVSGEKEE